VVLERSLQTTVSKYNSVLAGRIKDRIKRKHELTKTAAASMETTIINIYNCACTTDKFNLVQASYISER